MIFYRYMGVHGIYKDVWLESFLYVAYGSYSPRTVENVDWDVSIYVFTSPSFLHHATRVPPFKLPLFYYKNSDKLIKYMSHGCRKHIKPTLCG
jgi:hypothetical protein